MSEENGAVAAPGPSPRQILEALLFATDRPLRREE